MRRVFALPLLFLPALAFADCTAQLTQWAQALHPKRSFDAERSVCKVSPVDPRRTLAALVFVESEDDIQATYGLEVLTAYDGTIERHVYQSAAMTSDAVRFTRLSLDTARYQLNPEARAFGVRAEYYGSSRVNPYSAIELSLYVDDGAKLRKVLDRLEVATSGGEWDGNCAGEFYETTSSVAIGKAVSRGFAALEVTDKSSGSVVTDNKGDCTSKDSKPVLNKYVLTYNGTHYVVPANKKRG